MIATQNATQLRNRIARWQLVSKSFVIVVSVGHIVSCTFLLSGHLRFVPVRNFSWAAFALSAVYRQAMMARRHHSN